MCLRLEARLRLPPLLMLLLTEEDVENFATGLVVNSHDINLLNIGVFGNCSFVVPVGGILSSSLTYLLVNGGPSDASLPWS